MRKIKDLKQDILCSVASIEMMCANAFNTMYVYAGTNEGMYGDGGNATSGTTGIGTGYAWVERLTVGSSSDATESISYLLGALIAATEAIGYVVLIWSFVQWAMALKNDNPESKTKALTGIVTGAILIAFKTILQGASIIK